MDDGITRRLLAELREIHECRGNVLLVEDSEFDRDLARRMLEDAGCCVTTACDFESAAEEISNVQSRYNLILCDVGLPGADGVEVLRHARKILGAIPFVLVSGCMTQDVINRSREFGPVATIQKPLTRKNIEDIVSQFGVLK